MDNQDILTHDEKIEALQAQIKSLRGVKPTLELSPTDKPYLKEGIRTNGYKYSVRSNRDKFFFPGEWIKFFEALKDTQKPTFHFLINTGARINEARHVKVEDIDLINRRLVLRVTKVKSKKGEKNPRPRIIPISTGFAKWLKAYITRYSLSPQETLGFLSTPAAHLAMKKASEKAGISEWYMFSVHNVRKTFENWLMALDIDGLKITAHVGHSLAVAAGHYISADVFGLQERKDIRLILGDLYER